MASFMAICDDFPDSSERRRVHLQDHLSYIESIMNAVQVAGPLREGGDPEITASCFIYTAASLAEAQRLLTDDPYQLAGIYRSVRWFAFSPAAGSWVGGKNW